MSNQFLPSIAETGLPVQTITKSNHAISKRPYDGEALIDHMGRCESAQNAPGSAGGSGGDGRLEMGFLHQPV